MRTQIPRLLGRDIVVGAVLTLACVWIAAAISRMGDYGGELAPAMRALVSGDLSGFATLAPPYGASAWPRAPLAWLAHALGGSDLDLYRAGALTALLLAAGLALWLDRRMRAADRPIADRVCVAAVVLGAPVVLRLLADGHPEDLLAGIGVVAAVLLAGRERPLSAGCVLGAALACKPWAVLAFGPVLLAAPGRRAALTLLALGVAGAMVAPLLLLSQTPGGAGVQAKQLALTGHIFHPQQLLWPLRVAHENGGFTGPLWSQRLMHPLIVVIASLLSLVALVRRAPRRRDRASDALLLLALLLLVRCLLDPWNNAYYAVPVVLALASWEALTRRGLPVLALSATALTWLSFVKLPEYLGWDALAGAYLAWSIPLALVLGAALLGPVQLASSSAIAPRTAAGAS